jgi:hypothetical protein
MLGFLKSYPLGFYLQTWSNPQATAPKIGLYLSRDHTMMMLKKKGEVVFWNGRMRETPGSPGIENTTAKTGASEKTSVPVNYRKEFIDKLGLNRFNQVTVVLDDPETYTTPYTVVNFETANELDEALKKDPGSVITAWKNYSHNSEYIWEILSPGLNILRGEAKLPKKVILCGIPEERALHTAEWFDSMHNELANLIPAVPAILKWGVAFGPEEGFFFLIQTPAEIAMAYIEKKEIGIISTQKTKDGFTADEIADLNELVLEVGKDKNLPIWTWGLPVGGNAFQRLSQRYPMLKTLNAEELLKLKTLESKSSDEALAEKEAWLLDFTLE